jgi:hypothetical protein
MERYNNWQDRRDDRRRDERRPDESQYRGAYRLDEDEQYSTYNRSRQGGMGNNGRDRYNEDQGGDYVYRRSRNLQDNDDYTERQYQQSYRGGSSREGDYSDFGGRYGGSSQVCATTAPAKTKVVAVSAVATSNTATTMAVALQEILTATIARTTTRIVAARTTATWPAPLASATTATAIPIRTTTAVTTL